MKTIYLLSRKSYGNLIYALVFFCFSIGTTVHGQSYTFPTTISGPVNLASGTPQELTLNVGSVTAGNYYFFKVQANWSMGASNTAWSQSIQVGFNNGTGNFALSGAPGTYSRPESSATGQTNANSVTLNWTGIFRSEYVGGTTLRLMFRDEFTSGGPFNSVLNNIIVTIYQLPIGGGGGSDNLGDHTATQTLDMDGNTIDDVLNINSTYGAKLTNTGIWMNASDQSRKTNIKKLNYGLEELLKLNPVEYDYKKDGSHSIGFLAQEIEKVIPELV